MSGLSVEAAVWHGRHDLRVEPVTLPARVAPGWVRVQVEWCGLCGSDLEEYVRGPVVIPSPVSGDATPLVLGHEFAGVVSVVGPGVDALRAGDGVAVDTLLRCGRCHWCRQGDFNVCPFLQVVGLTLPGGLARYVDVPVETCYRIPAGLGLDAASLAEPLAVALRALARGGMSPETPLAVVGCGSIGLLSIAAAKLGGVARILAVEPEPARRALAVTAGATAAVQNVTAEALDAERPWLILDCSSGARALGAIVANAAPQSRVVVLGVGAEPVPVDVTALMTRELHVLGSVSHNADDFAGALELLARPGVDFGWIVAQRIGLREVPRALARLTDTGAVAGKIMVSLRDGA